MVHFWQAYTVGREPRPDEVHVREVIKKFADRGIQVVGVHGTEGAGRMSRFIAEQDIDWPCFVDRDNQSAEAWKTERRRNMIYLIDRQGKLRQTQVYQGDLQRALEVMLDEDESDNPKK